MGSVEMGSPRPEDEKTDHAAENKLEQPIRSYFSNNEQDKKYAELIISCIGDAHKEIKLADEKSLNLNFKILHNALKKTSSKKTEQTIVEISRALNGIFTVLEPSNQLFTQKYHGIGKKLYDLAYPSIKITVHGPEERKQPEKEKMTTNRNTEIIETEITATFARLLASSPGKEVIQTLQKANLLNADAAELKKIILQGNPSILEQKIQAYGQSAAEELFELVRRLRGDSAQNQPDKGKYNGDKPSLRKALIEMGINSPTAQQVHALFVENQTRRLQRIAPAVEVDEAFLKPLYDKNITPKKVKRIIINKRKEKERALGLDDPYALFAVESGKLTSRTDQDIRRCKEAYFYFMKSLGYKSIQEGGSEQFPESNPDRELLYKAVFSALEKLVQQVNSVVLNFENSEDKTSTVNALGPHDRIPAKPLYEMLRNLDYLFAFPLMPLEGRLFVTQEQLMNFFNAGSHYIQRFGLAPTDAIKVILTGDDVHQKDTQSVKGREFAIKMMRSLEGKITDNPLAHYERLLYNRFLLGLLTYSFKTASQEEKTFINEAMLFSKKSCHSDASDQSIQQAQAKLQKELDSAMRDVVFENSCKEKTEHTILQKILAGPTSRDYLTLYDDIQMKLTRHLLTMNPSDEATKDLLARSILLFSIKANTAGVEVRQEERDILNALLAEDKNKAAQSGLIKHISEFGYGPIGISKESPLYQSFEEQWEIFRTSLKNPESAQKPVFQPAHFPLLDKAIESVQEYIHTQVRSAELKQAQENRERQVNAAREAAQRETERVNHLAEQARQQEAINEERRHQAEAEAERRRQEEAARAAEEARRAAEEKAAREAKEAADAEHKREAQAANIDALQALLSVMEKMTKEAASNHVVRQQLATMHTGFFHTRTGKEDIDKLADQLQKNFDALQATSTQTMILLPKGVARTVMSHDEAIVKGYVGKQTDATTPQQIIGEVNKTESPRLHMNEVAINYVGDETDKACYVEHRNEKGHLIVTASKLPSDAEPQTIADNKQIPSDAYLSYASKIINTFVRDVGQARTLYIYNHADERLVKACILLCKAQNIPYQNLSKVKYNPDVASSEIKCVQKKLDTGHSEIERVLTLSTVIQEQLASLEDKKRSAPDTMKPRYEKLIEVLKKNISPDGHLKVGLMEEELQKAITESHNYLTPPSA